MTADFFKARDNKLTIEDMAGGSYTISNGGVFGSLMGTPIINVPQTGMLHVRYVSYRISSNVFTAVLGLHAIKQRPAVVNGKVEARPVSR